VVTNAQEFHTDWQKKAMELARAIKSGTVDQKRNALIEIRNIRTERASRLAVPALADAEEIVRATAVSSVIFLPKVEAGNILIPLLRDRSDFVRKEAVYAIGKVGDAKAMLGEGNEIYVADALWQLLDKEKSAEVRSAAIIALGQTGGLKSVERLYFYLNKPAKDVNDFHRRSAIRTIGESAEGLRNGTRIIPSLDRSFTSQELQKIDFSEDFRYFAAAAKRFIETLNDPKEVTDVRREAAVALGNIGSKDAIFTLTANLTSTDPYLAQNCKDALAKIAKLN
jgi:HEAT repeat protein